MSARKIILFISAITLVSIISELFYILYNPSPIITAFFIQRAHISASSEGGQKSLNYLSLDAKITLIMEHNKYPKFIPLNYNPYITIPDDKTLKNKFTNYISSLTMEDVKNDADSGIGKIFYKLGVIAYNSGHPELTPSFFSTAIYSNPELIYYHIELTNYYLSKGEKGKAQDTIKFCYSFKYPKVSCEEYFQKTMTNGIINPVGFAENTLDDYYK